MSHQTGISASENLSKFFAKCRDGKYRLLKVLISEKSGLPALELEESREMGGTWDQDWDSLLPPLVDSDMPAYFLYRLDDKDTSGNYFWIFISWSPDHAPTRQKMLYASTKATFKKEFGQGQIKDEYFASMREEVSISGYKRHLTASEGPGPLSRQEEEMKEIKENEIRVDIGVDTKQQTMSTLAFPVEKAATQAFEHFLQHGYDYIQLSIDISNEHILLEKTGVHGVEELPGLVPNHGARYHLFRYKHNFQGEATSSVVFIYSMPGYSVSIKERMLYSSCKNFMVDIIDKHYNIQIHKKIEIDAGSDLTEDFLMSELHPVEVVSKPKFSRPAPPSKGKKRITKAPPS